MVEPITGTKPDPSQFPINDKIFFINKDMWWSTEDMGSYNYLRTTNKDFLTKIIPHLNGKDVAVQAGGHCGWMVRELNKHFKYIYTFEPNAISFACLCMNLPGENVFKFQACVGNDHVLIGMKKHLQASGSDYINAIDGRIPTFKIDDLNLDICNFIQLDLEGYEYHALLGATKTIMKYRPLLCVERCWGPRYLVEPYHLDRLFTDLGYKAVDRLGESDYIYKSV